GMMIRSDRHAGAARLSPAAPASRTGRPTRPPILTPRLVRGGDTTAAATRQGVPKAQRAANARLSHASVTRDVDRTVAELPAGCAPAEAEPTTGDTQDACGRGNETERAQRPAICRI